MWQVLLDYSRALDIDDRDIAPHYEYLVLTSHYFQYWSMNTKGSVRIDEAFDSSFSVSSYNEDWSECNFKVLRQPKTVMKHLLQVYCN